VDRKDGFTAFAGSVNISATDGMGMGWSAPAGEYIACLCRNLVKNTLTV